MHHANSCSVRRYGWQPRPRGQAGGLVEAPTGARRLGKPAGGRTSLTSFSGTIAYLSRGPAATQNRRTWYLDSLSILAALLPHPCPDHCLFSHVTSSGHIMNWGCGPTWTTRAVFSLPVLTTPSFLVHCTCTARMRSTRLDDHLIDTAPAVAIFTSLAPTRDSRCSPASRHPSQPGQCLCDPCL